MNEKISKLMKNLGITEEEALRLLEDDKRIDKGENLFPLTKEQEKASKKARSVGKAPTVYKLDATGKKKKSDKDKKYLIDAIIESLNQIDINPQVNNPEREIEFMYNSRKFKIVLSAPRK